MTDDLNDLNELAALQAEVKRLLAEALTAERGHLEQLARLDELHVGEISRRDELHVGEMGRRDALHTSEREARERVHGRELEMLRVALESRDLIGQAKGLIMASVGCNADVAFGMLRSQSNHENRKLVDVAQDIVDRAVKARQLRAGHS